MQTNKIFGLGLSKTGTTSVCKALEILGYKTAHYIKVENFHEYDAIGDTPVPILYPRLDREYSDSKFILTTRDKHKWLKSFKKHMDRWDFEKDIALGTARADSLLTHYYVYGTLEYKPEKLLAGFDQYNQEVLNYFSDRPNDLLVMDIFNGDGWQQLCDFLGKPVPTVEFPRNNTADQVERHLSQEGHMLRKVAKYFSYKLSRVRHKIEVEKAYRKKTRI